MSDCNVTNHIILRFSPNAVGEPIVYMLVKEFDLIPNIMKASVNPDKEGYLVMALTGKENDYEQAVHRLQGMGVSVQDLMDRVKWDKDACTQCGACTAVCPSGALSLSRPEMTVEFDSDKCVVCHMCIQACPVNAVKLDF